MSESTSQTASGKGPPLWIIEELKRRNVREEITTMGPPDVKLWCQNLYLWALRVRRDILVLEAHMFPHLDPEDRPFYGDPGDPPPPPD